MTHGSLFSGIGGFDLAAAWNGFENKWQVEINEYCQKVLAKNFPEVKRYGDIRTIGKHNLERVDIISGGFPCQPFSTAGKRKGQNDDRFLWPEMLRVINEMQPKYIVCENVTGIINMALDKVLFDLEDIGYKSETFCIPACAINAPHRRDRIWIVSNSDSSSTRSPGQSERTFGEESKNNDEPKERGIKTKFSNGCNNVLYTAWNNWPVKPGVCGRNDGVSHRVDRIKGLGNAIVPQVAAAIFGVISQTENCI